MIRAILVYSEQQDTPEIPIIETTERTVLRLVAASSLETYKRAAIVVHDPIQAALITGEAAKARAVLKQLGLVDEDEAHIA